MNKSGENQYPQLTPEIWTTEENPYEGRNNSNRDERQMTIPRYENEMVTRRGPAICSVSEKGTAIKARRKGEHPHTRNRLRDPFGSPEPHFQTNLKKNLNSFRRGRQNLHQTNERSPQGGPRTSEFTGNGRFME